MENQTGVIADPNTAPLDFALQIWNGIQNGSVGTTTAVVLALILAVAVARKLQPTWFEGATSDAKDVRGVALALGLAFLGALGLAAGAGKSIDPKIAWGAFMTAAAAMGGYAGLWRRLLKPLLEPLWHRFFSKSDKTDPKVEQ